MKLLTMLPLLLLATGPARAELRWTQDFEQAAAQARKENKHVLVDFSGSDWCGWCKKLDREVFAQKEFQEYAAANLICVLIDFPREIPQSTQQREQNQKLQEKYEVSGYPTVFILDPQGKTIARTGYQSGGAQAYVDHLKQFIQTEKTANK